MFFHRLLFQSLAGWFVRGCLFGHPPTPPHKPRGTPYGGTALNATPLCHKGMDEGMFFLPLRWTERIGSCRANAMVVP
ncbi:MAG: hypothetical protein NTW61_01500, partial [Candidatus Melainabacteria bacterium]|nr:hypothetical protein [Candidatus Melainabacteria bacterium]